MVFTKDFHHFEGFWITASDLELAKPVQCGLLKGNNSSGTSPYILTTGEGGSGQGEEFFECVSLN